MPTYLYECTVNDIEFEEFHSIKTQLTECPICQEKGLEQHQPKRLISCSSKGVVQYTGHELEAKNKEDLNKLRKEVYSDPNKYANIMGESKYHEVQTQMDRRKR